MPLSIFYPNSIETRPQCFVRTRPRPQMHTAR